MSTILTDRVAIQQVATELFAEFDQIPADSNFTENFLRWCESVVVRDTAIVSGHTRIPA